ncbi:TetR family transcriptional regulator [Pseudonocardia nigra]|uniref:TetR family transcriptional regulator n=1 Tax=Pseudonocardia nigra TaxID=1921578 RepID=UPI001C5DF226|nr:TetR family transcriptional regulator [Pseudonocardia nigra]
MTAAGSRVRRGRSAAGRAEVRRALTVAAVELFTRRGYNETTVDDIAAAAGVGRRTFFRYFRGKEDAISPDHEAALAGVTQVFATAHPSEPTPSVVLRAGETVLDMYVEDADVALKRFRLVRAVPPLRDRESASAEHYRRLFTRELRERFADTDDAELRATVAAAAVVAAHNLALKAWLAAGARADGVAACRERFRRVAEMLPGEPGPETGLHAVARRLEDAVGRLEGRNDAEPA